MTDFRRYLQVRELQFEKTESGEETLLIKFSTETPVIRYCWSGYDYEPYQEILLHTDSSVNLERINNGVASLLFNHDYDRHLGILVPGGSYVDVNEKAGYARVQFSKVGELANEIRAKVEEGTIRAVSVSYSIDEYHQDDIERVLYADKWTVNEVSFVTVPADMHATVIRNLDGKGGRLILEDKETFEKSMLNTSVKDSPNKARNMATDIKKNKRAEETETEVTETETEVTETETETGNADQPENTDGNGDQPNPEDENANRADDVPAPTADEIAEKVIEILDARDEKRSLKANKVRTQMNKEKDTINTLESRFDLSAALRALADGKELTGAEAEYHQEMHKQRSAAGKAQRGRIYIPTVALRAAGDGNTTTNLADVTDTVMRRDSFVDLLLAKSVLGTLGVRVLSGLTEPVSIPKMTDDGSTGWGFVAEGQAVAETEMTFANALLKPFTFNGATPITRQAMKTVPGIGSLIADQMVKSGRIQLEKAMFSSAANANGPAGILSQLTATTSDYSYASFIATVAALTDAGVDENSIAYLMRGANKATLMTTLRDTGVNGYIIGDDGKLGGRPVSSSGVVEADKILVGDFSAITIGEWGALELDLDDTTYRAQGAYVPRIWCDIDWAVTQPEALTLLTPAA